MRRINKICWFAWPSMNGTTLCVHPHHMLPFPAVCWEVNPYLPLSSSYEHTTLHSIFLSYPPYLSLFVSIIAYGKLSSPETSTLLPAAQLRGLKMILQYKISWSHTYPLVCFLSLCIIKLKIWHTADVSLLFAAQLYLSSDVNHLLRLPQRTF